MAYDALKGAPVPADFVGDVLGVSDPERRKLLRRLVPALRDIDPDLVPQALEHAHSELIEQGVGAYDDLLRVFDAAEREDERVVALDAICQILEREHPTREVVDGLQKRLTAADTPAVLSMAARALAMTGDEPFLEQQRNFLASESPTELRRSVRLLGYGRHAASVPVLLELLRPDRMAVLDVLIWSLGEIRDPRAVPGLHAVLERFILTEAVLDALGKIGARVSVMRVLPVLLEGTRDQRGAAARALARIAEHNEGDLGDKTLVRSVSEALEKIIDQDDSRIVRFYALVAYGLLDGHLEPSRILSVLGGSLADDEVDGVGKLLKKSRKKGAARRGRKLI